MKTWTLVTGATAGIGKATALKLAAQGHNLLLLGRREDRLSQLVKEIGGERAQGFIVDISRRDSIEMFVKSNAALLSHVNVLVNNAGLAKGTEKVQDAKLEDWDAMIDTNVKGLLTLTRLLLPDMMKKESADIVNLGSVAGRWSYPGGAVYCATKFAVRAISECLRMDLMGSKVRVCNVEPGMVETEFSVVRLLSEEKAKAVYQGMHPLRAEDIADTIAWVLSRPRHVNIQEIVIFPQDQAGVGYVHRQA